jgi:hypothetical protein
MGSKKHCIADDHILKITIKQVLGSSLRMCQEKGVHHYA